MKKIHLKKLLKIDWMIAFILALFAGSKFLTNGWLLWLTVGVIISIPIFALIRLIRAVRKVVFK